MPEGRKERRLTAILAADVVDYSRMIVADETGTLAALQANIARLTSKVQKHGGRIIKTMGDGVLAEFASAAEALQCAVEFQRALAARKPGAQRLSFRIGINAGDALIANGDVFGDVVNVAARLQALAPPGGICVTARVHEDAMGRTAIAFEDMGDQRLKNIDRPVRVFRARLDASAARPTLALPDKPSIAVLPFENMSGDPAQEYLADGLTEDIISALSHWRWFFVIARNSSFIYKGAPADVTRVGRELGVRYVLEGSVRRSGDKVRVVAQLIDAADATHVWAETFDRDLSDLFALQDAITQHVVAAVEPAMMRSEGQRVGHKSIRDLTAFECAQRGMWHLNRMEQQDYDAALARFRECISRDPEMALGHVGFSRTLYAGLVYGFSPDPTGDLKQAHQSARDAIALDPQDAHAYYALAGALLYQSRHAEALDAAERSIALNPNFAFGYFRLGQILLYGGRPAEALAPIERSMRHNPYDPRLGSTLLMLAIAEYHLGEYEASIAHARAALRHDEWRAAAALGASLARLGRFEEAREALPPETLMQMASGMRLLTYANPADLAYAVEGMRLAAYGPTD